MRKLCKRCGNPLSGKQKSWCSPRCSRLGLKSVYKKKHKEKVNAYNRKYRKINKGGWKVKKLLARGYCYFCETKKEIHQHHLDYGKNIVVDICEGCHSKYHKLLKLQK